MKMKCKSIFLFLVVFAALLIPAFAQEQGRRNLLASRQITVNVPSQFPTLQEAVYSCPDVVLVEPGKYQENVQFKNCGHKITVRAQIPHTVIIDGGSSGNTFFGKLEGVIELEGLIIMNDQEPEFYNTAAVSSDLGGSVFVKNCQIFSRANGISTNYAIVTLIENSKFVGIGNQATALRLSHQNDIRERSKSKGAWILRNSFYNLAVAVDVSQSFYDAMLSDSPGTADTNSYLDVMETYLPSSY